MAGSLTKFGDISPRVGIVAAKRLLTRGQFIMVLERFGQFDPQPRNAGQTRKYRRYLSLTRALTPLSEGVTPDGQKLTFEDVTVNLKQYGDFLELTDVIEDTHEDPVLMQMMDLVGEQIAETIEFLRFIVVRAGTTVFFSGTATTRATVIAQVVRDDLRKVFRFLMKNKARQISQIVKASPLVSTEGIGEAFFGVGHTDLQTTFEDLTGWLPVEKYATPDKRITGEAGKIDNTRMILSAFYTPFILAGGVGAANTHLSDGVPNSAGTEKADVYPIIIFAKDAYSIVPLQGSSAVIPMVLNPKPTRSDPLGQRGSVGWKTWDASVILNQTWIARIECVADPLV